MKVGLMFANVLGFGSKQATDTLAEALEDSLIESVWTVEHVVVPQGYESAYPYSADGKMPGNNERSPIPDPLTWLSYMAARTTKVRLATGVLILPQRNPVVLAKELATLDMLSEGRVTLGVGIGWLEEEFDAIGIPFSERAARTDEAMQALRALWSEQETFNGRFHSFENARSYPKPVQRPIPIVVGGHSTASARRAGRLADGFFPAGGDFPKLFEQCRRSAQEAGRNPDDVELSAGGLVTKDFAARMGDLGVSRIITSPPTFNPADFKDAFARLSETIATF